MTNETVNEVNAYKFSDAYRIETVSEPIDVIGCEHNKSEAEAVAAYLSGERGVRCRVISNPKSAVAAAHSIRPDLKRNPVRFKHRDEAFRVAGIWK